MSRIGRKPVTVPDGVDVSVDSGTVSVKGKHGSLSFDYHPNMTVEYDSGQREVTVKRPNDERHNRSLHGLTRSLINNMVTGVTEPFVRRLDIIGVGYQASMAGNKLSLQVGYANTVELTVPDIVECEVPDSTHIIVRSPDKQVAGQFAAEIRAVRPPEPYKGKGIRYQNEHVRRKAGKAFGAK